MTDFYSKTAKFSIFSGTKNNQIIKFSLTIVNKNPQKIAKMSMIFPGTKIKSTIFPGTKNQKWAKIYFLYHNKYPKIIFCTIINTPNLFFVPLKIRHLVHNFKLIIPF